MNDESDNASKILGVAERVIDLASDSPEMVEAGRKLAKSTLTLTKAVDNCLLPIAAVNFAFDKGRKYFESRFRNDIEEATKDIPPNALTEPRASVVAPTLQGLAFAHEESDLKAMYLNLLSTAMDARKADNAHPAYAEIIRQLTSEEARLLNGIMNYSSKLPIVTLLEKRSIGIEKIIKNIIGYRDRETGEQVAAPQPPSMIDNWVRLGLISITYDLQLILEGSYDWVKLRPEYIELEKRAKGKVDVKKGILELTEFGKAFAEAVAIKR